jgi:hypothetical protein
MPSTRDSWGLLLAPKRATLQRHRTSQRDSQCLSRPPRSSLRSMLACPCQSPRNMALFQSLPRGALTTSLYGEGATANKETVRLLKGQEAAQHPTRNHRRPNTNAARPWHAKPVLVSVACLRQTHCARWPRAPIPLHSGWPRPCPHSTRNTRWVRWRRIQPSPSRSRSSPRV